MGMYGGFYKGDKKKPKRLRLEKEAEKIKRFHSVPKVEIIGRGNKGKKA